jgi:hypothetical protein
MAPFHVGTVYEGLTAAFGPLLRPALLETFPSLAEVPEGLPIRVWGRQACPGCHLAAAALQAAGYPVQPMDARLIEAAGDAAALNALYVLAWQEYRLPVLTVCGILAGRKVDWELIDADLVFTPAMRELVDDCPEHLAAADGALAAFAQALHVQYRPLDCARKEVVCGAPSRG